MRICLRPRRMIRISLVMTVIFMVVGGSRALKAEQMSDKDITSAVERKLQQNNRVSARDIDVSCSLGIVILSGFVDTLFDKEHAVRLSQTIKDVRAVINQLKIRPASRNDESVRGDVEEALRRDPATDIQEVKVHVREGIVALNGDEAIRKAVEDTLISDTRIVSPDTEVSVVDGTVVLSGVVGNVTSQKAVEENAWNTVGVNQVQNQLKISGQ